MAHHAHPLGGARVTFTEFQLEQLQVTALIQIEGTHEEIARDLMEAGTKKMLGKFGVATKATEPPPLYARRFAKHFREKFKPTGIPIREDPIVAAMRNKM